MNIPLSQDEQMFKNLYLNNKTLFLSPLYDEEMRKWSFWSELDDVAKYSFDLSGTKAFFNGLSESMPQYNMWSVHHPRFLPLLLHRLDQIKVISVIQGKLQLFINNTSYTLCAGDVCFVSPNVTHAEGAFDDDTIAINIFMKSSVLNDCYASLEKRTDTISHFFYNALYSSNITPALFVHCGDDEEIRSLSLKIYYEYQQKYDDFTCHMMEAYFMELLGFLLRNHGKDIAAINIVDKTEDPFLIECLQYLYKNYHTTNLNELSEKFHYSKSQLSRIIKQYTKKSFLEFTKDKKIQDAKVLLESSNLSIRDIAVKCGFKDLSNFYRVFKDETGVTPLDYREDHSTIEQQ